MANRILSCVCYFVLLLLLQKNFIKADSSDCGTASVIGKISGLIKSHKGFGTTLYPKILNCTWNIHPPTAYKVKVEFLVFDLENSTRCLRDHLMIAYGRTRHIFCGPVVPSAITTSSNVQLTFNTDENTEGLGFLIKYIFFREPSPIQQCGVITDMGGSGVLTSPNYPLNYTNDLSCRWTIKASHGKWLSFGLDLEMEGTVAEGCQYDYLSLHDMATDQPIRRYCGVIHSQSIKTNTNHIRIDFITDSQNTQSGFVMIWQSEDLSSNRHATTASKGSLSTTTSWETKTQSTPPHLTVGSSIQSSVHQYPVIIQSMPSLSSSSEMPNTQHYPKTIQSATPGSSVTPSIHQHQKTSRSTAIPSSSISSPASSTLQHQMKTRQALTSSRISPVSSTTKTSFPHSDSPLASTLYQTLTSGQFSGITVNTPACGSILFPNTSAGFIELPHQPNGEYFPSLDCQWLLVGEPGANIIVNFELFDVETSTDCAKDYLAFYDGASGESRMIARYCGKNLPASVIATANKMFIRFHSDQSVQGKGIMLQYFQMIPVTVPTLPVYHCPKDVVEIKSESGFLMSIGFTGYTNYSPNLNCQWQITTTPGKVLRLRFSDFETEYAEGCQYDHLEIWDSLSRKRTMLGKYCGIRLPRDIITDSNTVYIKFVSDGAVSGIGFNLTYHTIESIASCTKYQYKCIDGSCIDRSAVCDNKTDCPDNTDELFCDINKTCGRPSIKATLQERRIVGGQEAVRGSWPWQVTVSHKGTFMCGGSLLNPYWVITAAHCFGLSIIPREWQVGVGKHYLMQAEKGVETNDLADIIIHPQYNSHTSYNDIALLRLKHPVNMTSRISTICLPIQPQHIGQNCYVTGWGDSYDTCCPDVLKQAMVPVLNTTLCNNTNHYNGRLLDSMFCAGYTSRQIDACHGDSGGPLVSLYSDGKWYLQGIISWGIGCADSKHPGIYTGVYQFNSWIQSVIYQM